MAMVNFGLREIEAKIVYYGPALSGKTTNVKLVHAALPDSQRGELSTLSTEDERTLYFDYAPITLGKIAGFNAHFKLFSVPGQAFYSQTRRAVLQGADGVVFVADSAPDRMEANLASLQDLEDNLKALNMDLDTLPFVIQLNKRDVPGALSEAELAERLNRWGAPLVPAVALTGEGVERTLKAVTDLTADRIRDHLVGQVTGGTLTAVDRAEREDDASVILRQLQAIQAVRPAEVQKAREHLERGEVGTDDVDAFLFRNVQRDRAATSSPAAAGPAPDDPRVPRIPDLVLGLPTPANAEWVVHECRSATVDPRGALVAQLLLEDRRSGRRAALGVTVEPRPQEVGAPRRAPELAPEPRPTPPQPEPKAPGPAAPAPSAGAPGAGGPGATGSRATPRPEPPLSPGEVARPYRRPPAPPPSLPFPAWLMPVGIAGALALGLAIGLLLRS